MEPTRAEDMQQMWRERVFIAGNFSLIFLVQGIAIGFTLSLLLRWIHGPTWLTLAIIYTLIGMAMFRNYRITRHARAIAAARWKELRKEAWDTCEIALPEDMPDVPTGLALLRAAIDKKMEETKP